MEKFFLIIGLGLWALLSWKVGEYVSLQRNIRLYEKRAKEIEEDLKLHEKKDND